MKGPKRACCTVLLAIVFLVPIGSVSAQADSQVVVTPDFNSLKTPESPAFHILGISPSSISRPTSPRGFAVSVLDALKDQEKFSLIPANLAIEINPYWWSLQPDISFEEYQKGGFRNLRNLYRTLTFSLATTDSTVSGPDGDRSFRRLGFGFRANLFGGQDALQCQTQIQAVTDSVTARVEQIVKRAVNRRGVVWSMEDSLEFRARKFDEVVKGLTKTQLRTLGAENREGCTDKIADRQGLVFSVAGAAAYGFLGDPTGVPQGGWNRLGLWVTPSYLRGPISLIGVGRLLWEERAGDAGDRERAFGKPAFDFGARAIYSLGRFAASLEAIYRQKDPEGKSKEKVRLAAVLDVRLMEDLWLTTTFGTDPDGERGSGPTALANLQWNLGKPGPRPAFPEGG